MGFVNEPGLTVRLVSLPELAQMITSGEFVSHLHLATLFLAEMRSYLQVPREATLSVEFNRT